MTKKILALAALAILSQVASAQGFMGGRGMRSMFQSTTVQSLMMLRREDVQEEIKMTDEQKGKLNEMQAGAQERFRNVFSGMRPGDGGDREAMMKAVQEKMQVLFEELSKTAMQILDEPQKKRIKELVVQSQGSLAVLQPDVDKEIGSLTAAQKAQIDDLQTRQEEATRNLFEQRQNGDIDQETLTDRMEKNKAILDAEIVKLLTEPQRTKLKTLSGKPFEFKDPKPGTPGSWGRPGGGR